MLAGLRTWDPAAALSSLLPTYNDGFPDHSQCLAPALAGGMSFSFPLPLRVSSGVTPDSLLGNARILYLGVQPAVISIYGVAALST